MLCEWAQEITSRLSGGVLILVLMEDALRELYEYWMDCELPVLILVLMEDALRETTE